MKTKSKWAVTIVAAFFLVILYMVIWGFSSQNGESSSGLSREVTKKCVEVVDTVAKKDWTDKVKAGLVDMWELPIRKAAHFTEYTCMGILVYLMWWPWITEWNHGTDTEHRKEHHKEHHKEHCKEPRKRRRKWPWKLFFLVVVWVFLSASADEIHQTFSIGRDGNIRDVLLDTCGGAFGASLCVWIAGMYQKVHARYAR